MEITTGFFALARSTSRRIISLATAEPPGESTRRMMALTSSSSRARRRSAATVSDPITKPSNKLQPELPVSMVPVACTTASFAAPSFFTSFR